MFPIHRIAYIMGNEQSLADLVQNRDLNLLTMCVIAGKLRVNCFNGLCM